MILGEYIKDYRRTHKLSQDDFAARLGLSKAYISILERNYNPSTGKPPIPSWETIYRVAQATMVPFPDLVDMLDENQAVYLEGDFPKSLSLDDVNKESSPDERQLTEGETALIQLFRQIPEDKQRIVIEMIRAALSTQL